MYGGRIVEEAPAAELYRDPLHPYSDGLLHSFPALRGAAPRADRHPRLAAGPGGDADRLRVPPALPEGVRPLRQPTSRLLAAPAAHGPVEPWPAGSPGRVG